SSQGIPRRGRNRLSTGKNLHPLWNRWTTVFHSSRTRNSLGQRCLESGGAGSLDTDSTLADSGAGNRTASCHTCGRREFSTRGLVGKLTCFTGIGLGYWCAGLNQFSTLARFANSKIHNQFTRPVNVETLLGDSVAMGDFRGSEVVSGG